ncbi:RluA family pseudouridine synthase [Levilactobacillus parabrevis]|uniref:RluA family pseudouridine synthase n=1 Tax=Levilactobacillus parabrevis TaxID=357278 RepID=UPI0021A639F5|nr:RluA family pseudouridine synthase [Levilactobacillus parabrevis]MCT4486628.1 RluA family pseudouridine synthase [Levilactobacillus parabrevis]MCT4489164.1 RluA family pseudouridine synthase [Levilactobacillus parabrevis]
MDWTYTITIPSNQAPLPLRQLLSTWLIPKHLIHDLRISQRVLVNGAYRSMNQLVTAGDTVHLTFLPADFAEPFPDVDPDSAATVAVLYETTDLLIINKTRGSKTHPNQPGERGTTLNHVAAYLGDDQPGPYILSRLDQETTGALMMTKTPAVVPIMVRNIAEKRVQRTYLAWVHGQLTGSGTFTDPIGRDPQDKRKRQVNGLNAQSAITHYEAVDHQANATLVKLWLETGRTHQLRVHLAAAGHPLIGDPLYAAISQDRLRLHCWRLTFPQPFTVDSPLTTVTAPIPADFGVFSRK